jgi:hypothetical protein
MAPHMKSRRWDYDLISLDTEKGSELLAALAASDADGWELVAAIDQWTLIVRRPHDSDQAR